MRNVARHKPDIVPRNTAHNSA